VQIREKVIFTSTGTIKRTGNQFPRRFQAIVVAWISSPG
jgi:hypothetical protein